MSVYEHQIEVNASADHVFEFVSQPANMPEYMPTVTAARPDGAERVRLEGVVNGRSYVSDGRYHIDKDRRRMEWNSDGENEYKGWLQVQGVDDYCRVLVHLAFEPRPDQDHQFREQMRTRDEAIRTSLEAALEAIRDICEGTGAEAAKRRESGYMA